MGYFQRYGSVKPGLGFSQIDLGHPFSKNLLLAVLFNEGRGPAIITPGSVARGYQKTANTGSPTWSSNTHGLALHFPTTSDYITITDGTFSFLPSKNITIVVIRRKTDTTNRGAGFFGTTSTTASRCGAHCPYDDGIVYFDFGGTSSPNRLTKSGLSFSTTTPEKWIFHAGDAGSAIWQNGVKVASQSTAISRTVANDNLTLNVGNGVNTCDIQDINYFAIYSTQWSDFLCQSWSSSPYEHLYSEIFGNKFYFLGAISSDVTGTLTETIPLIGLAESGSYKDNLPNTQTWPPGNVTLPIRQFTRFS